MKSDGSQVVDALHPAGTGIIEYEVSRFLKLQYRGVTVVSFFTW